MPLAAAKQELYTFSIGAISAPPGATYLQLILGALPAAFLLLATAAARCCFTGPRRTRRESLLIGALATGVWNALGTEILSLLGWIGFAGSLTLWGVGILALGVLVALRRHAADDPPAPPEPRSIPVALVIGATIAVLGVAFAVAAATPPNNADALSYHLPRQIRWLQQGSLDLYPANSLRQLVMPTLSESFGVHLLALSDSDAWHNLVQWVALVVCASGASLISRELGGSRLGQSLAAFATVTMPPTLMQGSNAKNDVLLAAWILCLMLCAVRILREGRCNWQRAAMIGVSLGLAMLTKGTGTIVAAPICLTIGVALLVRQRLRSIPHGVLMLAIACSLNAGYWARNIAVYDAPFGPPDHKGGFAVTNETHAPRQILSVFVRSVALHAGTPIESLRTATDQAVRRLHEAMSLDINDPRTTYHASPPFSVPWTPAHEDGAAGPVHLLLAIILLPVSIIIARRDRDWVGLIAISLPYAAFILMCALLKWQIWNTRLHIPIACMLCAVAGPMLGRCKPAGFTFALAMLAAAMPSLLLNHRRPLIGENALFSLPYQDRIHLGTPNIKRQRHLSEQMVRRVQELKPSAIGLIIGHSGPDEYLAMRAIRRAGMRTQFVSFVPMFGPWPKPGTPVPDLVLWIPFRGGDLVHRASRTTYVLDSHFGQYWIFVPGDPSAMFTDPYPPESVSIKDRFRGWTLVEGLGNPEGPYPQWNLPQVRWGLGDRTVLTIKGVGRELELITTCRSNGSPRQGIVVRVNGRRVQEHIFANAREFETIRVPLGAVTGEARLTLQYTALEPPRSPSGRPTSVLYKSIVVVPYRPLEPSPGEQQLDQHTTDE